MNRKGVLGKAFTTVPVMLLIFFIMIIFLVGTVAISKINNPNLSDGEVELFRFSIKNEAGFVPLGARSFDTFVHYTNYPSITATSSKSFLESYFVKNMDLDTCVYLDIEKSLGQKGYILIEKDSGGHINQLRDSILTTYRLQRKDIADNVKYSLINKDGNLVKVNYFFYYGKCLGSSP